MFEIAFQYLNPVQSRAKVLSKHLKAGEEISEPVAEIVLTENERILAFVCLHEREMISHISWGRTGNKAGTKLTKLNLDRPVKIASINVKELVKRDDWKEFSDFFSDRDVFKGSVDCRDFIQKIRDEFSDVDDYISQTVADYELIDKLSVEARSIVRQEHDAVEMALRIANMIPRSSYDWSPTKQGKSEIRSFFTGLQPSGYLEDDIVRWELDKIPGFEVLDKTVFGHYVLGDGKTVLHTFHANKNALEKTMGVDLIYFNEQHESFILVQYKMAEPQGGDNVFRFPNQQLTTEVKRMDAIHEVLLKEAKNLGGNRLTKDYRITEDPFFLKFCPRDGFDPDANEQVRGMIIPLSMWRDVEGDVSSAFDDPQGGKIFGFENCPRYFDNTGFKSLIQEGWVGTSSVTRAFLEGVVTEIINNGKSLVLAAKLAILPAVAGSSPKKRKRRPKKKRASNKRTRSPAHQKNGSIPR